MVGNKKKKAAKPATPAATHPDSDDDMPALEPVDPDKRAAAAAATTSTPPPKPAPSSQKKPTAAAGKSKSDDEWDDKDSDDDMPALTDEAGVAGRKVVLRPVTFGKGTTKSKLFDFEPFEADGVEAAYKHLGLDPKLTDSALQSEATKIMSSETSAQRGHKDTSSRLGALLTILCSRTDLKTIPEAPSTSHSLARSLRLLYLSEAQLHLTALHLPLPADAVVPSDVDLRTDAMAYDFLTDERKAHERTRERLKQAQVGLEKATTSGTAARTKADKCEAEAKSLRGEVSRLKGEGDILKDQAREGFRAKDEVLREVDRLKEDVERHKREAQAAAPGSDKKDFVVQRLSKQVVELNKQLRAKQDENLKLVLELATRGG
ncbi:hypothetical protein JCM9279_002643 [Rhodotorula babjevae]